MDLSSTASASAHIDDDELVRFVDGALSAERASEIRAHVDGCDECRQLLAVAGQEAVAAGDRPSAPSDLVDAPFRIERELGRGGMSRVYLATHLASGDRVALKVLSEELAADEEGVERFMRETRVAAKLRSRHTARVYDVGRFSSGVPYMAMELLDGEDLDRVARRVGRLPIADTLAYAHQACDALGEAHAAGIVHRDVKLQNLFLARVEDGVLVKVIDFGLAKGIGGDHSLTREGALMGTPRYMSPEQVLSARAADARTDVWSLGVCLYRLLSGAFPFDSDHLPGLVARIVGTPPRSLRALAPEVSPPLEALVMRCLARQPADRYADALELGLALAEIQTPRVLRRPRKARAMLTVAAAVVVGTALTLVASRRFSPVPVEPVAVVTTVPVANEPPPVPPATVSPATATSSAQPPVRPRSPGGLHPRPASPPAKSARSLSPVPAAPSGERLYEDM